MPCQVCQLAKWGKCFLGDTPRGQGGGRSQCQGRVGLEGPCSLAVWPWLPQGRLDADPFPLPQVETSVCAALPKGLGSQGSGVLSQNDLRVLGIPSQAHLKEQGKGDLGHYPLSTSQVVGHQWRFGLLVTLYQDFHTLLVTS